MIISGKIFRVAHCRSQEKAGFWTGTAFLMKTFCQKKCTEKLDTDASLDEVQMK
jgi:hypothetical protein